MDANDLLKLLLPLVGATGSAAWAGVKMALNGTRKHIASVSKKVDDRCDTITASVDNLAGQVTNARIDIGRLEGQIGEMKDRQPRPRKRAK